MTNFEIGTVVRHHDDDEPPHTDGTVYAVSDDPADAGTVVFVEWPNEYRRHEYIEDLTIIRPAGPTPQENPA